MFGLGKNQMIMILGGLVVVGAGFAACWWMPEARMQAFLGFVGPFAWKVIVGALSGSALIKAAGALKGNGPTP